MQPIPPINESSRVVRRIRGRATSEGAGVKLTRVIGGGELPDLDPFLLLDEFGTDRPEEYLAGFPDHPHRGFETVTYMLDGRMRHRDNHGNQGLLGPGSVQWMTAGRGLVHSEMPEQESGRMRGFQLWVNLPARDKMTAPRYQEFPPELIPVAYPAAGVVVKAIAGKVCGYLESWSEGVHPASAWTEVRGPIDQPATDPIYLDIALAANARWNYLMPEGHNAFAYAFEGALTIGDDENARTVDTRELAVLGGGERFVVTAGASGARLLLVSGRPLREPVARHGPFVLNTREQLMQAFVDFQEGRF